MDRGHSTQANGDFSRADRRLLNRLNAGFGAGEPPPREQVNRLIESGYIERDTLGELTITTRGQFALARWRFRNLPKPRMVVVNYEPSRNLWQRLFL